MSLDTIAAPPCSLTAGVLPPIAKGRRVGAAVSKRGRRGKGEGGEARSSGRDARRSGRPHPA